MTPKPCFLTLASALHSRTCAPNLARRFAAKPPPYPTKPTTARALDSTRFEQARQILVRRFAFTNPPIPTKPTTAGPLSRTPHEQAGPFLARRFAASNPPNPTKPTTVQAVDSARVEQARQILVRRFAFANPPIPTKPTNAVGHYAQRLAFAGPIKNQPKPTSASYTCPVTSKKGVIGIGLPCNPLRRKPQPLPQSTCGLFVRASIFWRLGQGAARLAGSRKRVPGRPTCSSRRPRLVSGASVFANRTCCEALNG